jgi:hypothetical protein
LSQNRLLRLANCFAFAALMACYAGTAKASGNSATSTSLNDTNYLIKVDLHKHKIYYFTAYDRLPRSYQIVIDRCTDIKGHPAKSGKELYDHLSIPTLAGLLNILTKASVTLYADGTSELSHLVKAIKLQQDRLFGYPSDRWAQEASDAEKSGSCVPTGRFDNLFHKEGREITLNCKTPDERGGLQSVLHGNGIVELDIDEEKPGGRHSLRALLHIILHRKSNPINIGKILRKYQKLDPLYSEFDLTRPTPDYKAAPLIDAARP